MRNEIQDLMLLLQQTFEKGAWHGPSVKETLNGVDSALALRRLPDTHNIIELVSHMAAWKTYTFRKMTGDISYEVTDDLNFPALADWPAALQRLDESHNHLLSALAGFPAEKLGEQVPGTKKALTFYSLIHGVIHHDLYHAGQIMLIRKAAREQTI